MRFEYLAIDWGSKRFGIAFGSSEPFVVLPYRGEFLEKQWRSQLLQILLEKKPRILIVGRPTTFDGRPTEVTVKIEEFATELKLLLKNNALENIEVQLYNERETTKFAHNLQITNKTDINHAAAVRLLELWVQHGKK